MSDKNKTTIKSILRDAVWFTRESWKYMRGSRARFFVGFPGALFRFLRSAT
jgi:hypothetical protein